MTRPVPPPAGGTRPGTDPRPGPDADRAWLRVLYAVPLALLTLPAAGLCWLALSTRPGYSGDEDAYRGIETGCFATVCCAGLAVLFWLLPPVRRVLRWPWVAPAALLLAAAAVRWATVPG